MKNNRWTTDNIPDLTSKVAVVTGANTGLGFETALALASKGATVIMAVRSVERGEKAKERILAKVPQAKLFVQECDLASFKSTHAAANEIKDNFSRIDILINNAGVLTKRGLTEDGYELRFGTNHLGHYVFTGLLLDTILDTPNSRIVSLGSVAHRRKNAAPFENFKEAEMGMFPAYARSKIACILFSYQLAKKLEGSSTISVVAHPGVAKSDIIRGFPRWTIWVAKKYMQPTAMGAL
ncbi:MAG: SDR family NAD(P)-dependent oxidoreductase, partial [Firmicutes bacterium]|nr:SDR family NAD(P)-dependent oxidoreductase [Bacillota bacterium]